MKKLAALLTVAHVSRYFGQLAVLLGVSIVGTASEVGNYVLGMALAGPVFVIAGLGMRTLVLTHNRHYSLSRYLQVRTLTGFGAAAITALLALAFLQPELRPMVLFVIVAKFSELFLDLASAWWQRYGKAKLLASVSLGSSLVVVATAFGTAMLGGTAVEVVAFSALAGLGWAAFVAIPILVVGESRRVARGGDSVTVAATFWSSVKDIVRSGIPLGFSYGSVNLLGSIPQYILAAVGTLAQVGQFGVLYYIVIAGEVVVNPVAQAWLSKARKLEASGELTSRFLLRESLHYGLRWAPLALLGVVAGSWLLPLIFGQEFSFDLVTGLVIWAILVTLPFIYFGANALAVKNRYSSALLIVLPALAVSLGLSLLLIPGMGPTGAFLAYFGANACRAVLPYLVLRSPSSPHDNDKDRR